ncbi:MAG: lactate racemase domain-containing protein, partial [Anaerolineae bacterium]|nr:lactate racemase domain-containing protein [Anaerolineae bacterium]
MIGTGSKDHFLNLSDLRQIMVEGFQSLDLADKKVLFIIPDGTRTMPMAEMFAIIQEELVAKQVDFLVALGTHQPMTDAQLSRHLGVKVVNGVFGGSHIYNHDWEKVETFVAIGTIPASEIEELSNGMLSMDVPVRLNKLVLAYDQIII